MTVLPSLYLNLLLLKKEETSLDGGFPLLPQIKKTASSTGGFWHTYSLRENTHYASYGINRLLQSGFLIFR